MFRLIFAFGLLAAVCNSNAHAQTLFRGGFLKRNLPARPHSNSTTTRNSRSHAEGQQARVPNRYRTPYPTSAQGISVGFGSYPNYNYPRPGQFDPYRFDNYVHDPYITGSFKAPDLLKDPYFRERHRYDSHFPGRARKPSF